MFEQQVSEAIRQVSDSIIMPRYRHLDKSQIFEKGPGDLVTVADRESELALSEALIRIDPTSVVVGEEAVAAKPETIEQAQASGNVWIIDPIDGTGAFARGKPRFAVMVALLQDAVTTTSWIWQPVDRRMYVGSRSAQPTMNGKPVRTDSGDTAPRSVEEMAGIVRTNFLEESHRRALESRVESLRRVRLNRGGACGYVYPELLEGTLDFAMFSRQYPWDHAPGALMIERAGGAARTLDGAPYDPTRTTFGLLCTRKANEWESIRDDLLNR